MTFYTDYRYVNREDKAKYVWLKYRPILTGKILDVGADECHLKRYLPPSVHYWGIGLGGNPDQQVDLESEGLPFPDNSFDCVLCLDVLEHLNNAHTIFDEVCRVTRHYAIISLPNAWAGIINFLRFGDWESEQHLKYYGLPAEIPVDRHKWFFSFVEAENFVRHRSKMRRMQVLQIDEHRSGDPHRLTNRLFRGLAFVLLRFTKADPRIFLAGSMWALLQKEGSDT